MNKNLLITIGVIILFLGLAIQPSIATPQLKEIDVEPDIEGLVAQLRVVINEILQDYRHIPIVRSLANTILNTISDIGRIIVCVFLYIIIIPLTLLAAIGLSLKIDYLWYLFGTLATFVALILDMECREYFNPPSKSIYTMLDTNDITNLVDECPCMQE